MSSEGGFVRHVVTFGRVLREAGLEVGPGRISDALTGLDRVDISKSEDVYWALRATLVSRAEDLESFDRAFAAWFLRSPSPPLYRGAMPADRAPGLAQRTMRADRARISRGSRGRSPGRNHATSASAFCASCATRAWRSGASRVRSATWTADAASA